MLSARLKYYFICKKITKLLKTKQSKKTIIGDKKISSIGILTKEKFRETYDLQQITTKFFSIRKPRIYSFRAFRKGQQKSYEHFSEKDFNWKGNIKETSLQSFLNEPFDLLICYFAQGNTMLKYAALVSKASFKVGFTGVNTNLFDLNVRVDLEEVDQFFFESKKYLTILGKL